jgi:hypothetical protein
VQSPGPGGTENICVSMPSELLGALRTRTGKRGLSAYVTATVRHQLAMDGLAEIVHGPASMSDGTMNLMGALRRTMATSGYSDLKEFQRVEVVVAPH